MFEEKYETHEKIPVAVRYLYAKNSEGKYELIKPSEIKTVQDVTNLQEALRKERDLVKASKAELAKFKGLDPEETLKKLDRIAELEAANSGKLDDEKINKIVESRIAAKTAPIERERDQFKTETDKLKVEVADFKLREVKRSIRDEVRKSAVTAKVRETAIEDALIIGENLFEKNELGKIVTKDNVGITPGLSPDVWFAEIKDARPHWWPESKGAGAGGGDGGFDGKSNPFSAEGWNLTEQGRVISQSVEKAEQLAKAAGTSIAGGKPVKEK